MAETLLSLEQVCKELQLNKEQVIALVKSGALRGFLDQKTYKFRRSDVEKYKEAASSSATVMFEEKPQATGQTPGDAGAKKDASKADTSKIDLAEIEAEAGADESDQTSVLAPVEERQGAPPEEQPIFEFSEKELGLEEEAKEGEEEEQPSAILPQEESESSLDILEVAEESSSETSTSTADLDFVDESSSSSGVEVAAVLDMEEESSSETSVKKPEKGETVSDLLATSEESSDEELETLEVDRVVETQDTILEEPAETKTAAAAEVPEAGTAETIPVAEEPETVGLTQEEATKALAEEVEAVAPPAEEEEEAEVAVEPAHVAAGWELVTPSIMGNVFLALAIVLSILGGFFIVCEVTETSNALTDFFRANVATLFP